MMELKENRIFLELLTVFFIRQGIWAKEKTMKLTNLVQLTYSYFFGSFLIFLGMVLFKYDMTLFLKESSAFSSVRYYDLLVISLVVILLIGISYENYFFIKTNTHQTLAIFFRMNNKKIFFINALKTMIIVLPVITFLCFYYTLWPLLYSFAIYSFSYFILVVYSIKQQRSRLKNRKMIAENWLVNGIVVKVVYIFRLFTLSFFFKALFLPIISILLFALLLSYGFNIAQIAGSLEAFIVSFFLSAIIFNDKGLVYGFLALMTDSHYLKGFQYSSKRFLIRGSLVLYLVQTIPALILFVWVTKQWLTDNWSWLFMAGLGLLTGSILLTLIHAVKGLKLNGKFDYSSQLEGYTIPLKENLFYFIQTLPLLASVALFKIVNEINGGEIIFLILFLMTLIIYGSYLIKQIQFIYSITLGENQ